MDPGNRDLTGSVPPCFTAVVSLIPTVSGRKSHGQRWDSHPGRRPRPLPLSPSLKSHTQPGFLRATQGAGGAFHHLSLRGWPPVFCSWGGNWVLTSHLRGLILTAPHTKLSLGGLSFPQSPLLSLLSLALQLEERGLGNHPTALSEARSHLLMAGSLLLLPPCRD